MIGAAWYLVQATLRNRARSLVRRFRNPRYATAVVLGAGYLWLVLVRPGGSPSAGVISPAAAEATGGALLAVLVLKWWVFGADRQALAFSPAEVQFLFPAPVTRQALIRYKLLRAQIPIALNVLVWTLLLRRSGPGLPALLQGVNLYLFFSILFLHRLGAALTRDALLAGGWRRRWGVLAMAGGAGALVIGGLWSALPALESLTGQGRRGLAEAARLVLESAPVSWVVFPFRAAVRPLSADSPAAWPGTVAGTLVLFALHVLWVLRADRAFEEAAVEASLRQAERLERRGEGRRLPGGSKHRLAGFVPLAASGHPVRAIVWKNQVRLLRTASAAAPVLLMAAMLLGVVAATAGGESTVGGIVGVTASSAAILVTLFGPLWIRNDLRGDLEELALLRSWPLSGRAVVAAEIFSSTLALTALQLPLVLASLLALPRLETALQRLDLVAVGASLAILLPAVNLAALTIQNAGALLFPAWVRTEIRPGGIEATGQHILTMGGSVLLLLVLLLGPAVLAVLVAAGLWTGMGQLALVPAALAAALGLGLEVFLLIEWLGGQFERMDPSQER